MAWAGCGVGVVVGAVMGCHDSRDYLLFAPTDGEVVTRTGVTVMSVDAVPATIAADGVSRATIRVALGGGSTVQTVEFITTDGVLIGGEGNDGKTKTVVVDAGNMARIGLQSERRAVVATVTVKAQRRGGGANDRAVVGRVDVEFVAMEG